MSSGLFKTKPIFHSGSPWEKLQLAAVTELVPSWVTELQQSYEGDPWVAELRSKREAEKGSDNPKYTIHQGLVRRVAGRICVGNQGSWREKLFKEVHDSSMGGHSGVLATYKRLKSMFFWPGLKESVHQYVSSCEICQMNKGEHIHTPGLLQPLPIPEGAWSSISLDFIVGLPKAEGKDVILVVVDRLTKYAHFIPLSHPYKA